MDGCCTSKLEQGFFFHANFCFLLFFVFVSPRLTRLLLIWHIERTIALLNAATTLHKYRRQDVGRIWTSTISKGQWARMSSTHWHIRCEYKSISLYYWKQQKKKSKTKQEKNDADKMDGIGFDFIEWHIEQKHVPFAFGCTHLCLRTRCDGSVRDCPDTICSIQSAN